MLGCRTLRRHFPLRSFFNNPDKGGFAFVGTGRDLSSRLCLSFRRMPESIFFSFVLLSRPLRLLSFFYSSCHIDIPIGSGFRHSPE